MFNGIVADNSVSFILVFLEGILSFFSPCVIPLIPVYMGYLAGNGQTEEENGTIRYDRKKVFLHTVFFTLGISGAFFLLGMSFTTLGSFFNNNKVIFTRAGGILILVMGLFQLGIFDFSFLQKERKIHLNLNGRTMNPLVALALGFTFSFAWTPCIGPALSSVLILASGATTSLAGNMLVIVYALGFLIPFLILGLFTTQALNFLKSRQKLLKYTMKAGGIILVIMGVMTFTGWMNAISGYLNTYQPNTETVSDRTTVSAVSDQEEILATEEESTEAKTIPAFDFTLTDQYGVEHTLSDYKGKVVFINFWATWCPPCKKELPDIESLYKKYGLNKEDVIFLGVANPSSDEYPNNSDADQEKIKAFLDENGYTFPVLFDETGEVLRDYYISSFPTTFMINKEGNIAGYVPGMMTMDIMENVIEQTIQQTE